MLDRRIDDRIAWRADTLDASACRVTLPQRCLDALDRAVADLRARPAPIEAFSIEDYDHPALREVVAPVAEALDSGSGVATA